MLVLSPPLISNSLSVGLEPKQTSVIHNSTSPKRLLTSAITNCPRRLTQDPDKIGGSVRTVPRASLPEQEETSIFAQTPPVTQVPVPVPIAVATHKNPAEIYENATTVAEICAVAPSSSAPVLKATVDSLPPTLAASVFLQLPSVLPPPPHSERIDSITSSLCRSSRN